MALWHIIVLAILQGLTEFLPISSSAHLILVPKLTGWDDQGLAFDVAVHVGTLLAVIIYFRSELIMMGRDWFISLRAGKQTAESRLAWGVLLGTIPVGLFGLLAKDFIESDLRSTTVIATTTILFGLLLWWADSRCRQQHNEYQLSLRDILVIGLAQAIALIPGTSRSGITITAGLLLGLTREAAARFSFLLSIPVIVLAGGLETLKLAADPNPIAWQELILGAAISGTMAFLCIHFFLRLLRHMGMLLFVLYRLLLGVILFLAF